MADLATPENPVPENPVPESPVPENPRDDFQWTTGDDNLEHIRRIAVGGYGAVHEVTSTWNTI